MNVESAEIDVVAASVSVRRNALENRVDIPPVLSSDPRLNRPRPAPRHGITLAVFGLSKGAHRYPFPMARQPNLPPEGEYPLRVSRRLILTTLRWRILPDFAIAAFSIPRSSASVASRYHD